MPMSEIINFGAIVTMLPARKQDLTMGCCVSQKIYVSQALHISEIVPELIY